MTKSKKAKIVKKKRIEEIIALHEPPLLEHKIDPEEHEILQILTKKPAGKSKLSSVDYIPELERGDLDSPE